MDNSIIRQDIKQKRLALSEITYQAMSLSCLNQLKQLLSQKSYQTIGIYMSTNHEVDTHELFQYLITQKKQVYIPKCEGKGIMNFYEIKSMEETSIGKYNIIEPKTTIKNNQLDIIIVPLVAYDSLGYRLGMGGGYYDRFLEKYPTQSIGLGFSFQEKEFYVQSHDQQLDYVINENEVIKFFTTT